MFIFRSFVVVIFYVCLTHSADANSNILTVPIKLTENETVTLSDFKGKKPVYLKFWASWCRPCMKEMPHFQSAYEKYGDSVQFISINLGINDSSDDVDRVVREFGLGMSTTIDTDGKLAQAFKFIGTPYHLLFDKNMNLVHRGHKANESLDNKMSLISTFKDIEHMSSSVFSKYEKELVFSDLDQKSTGFFFTATWCDWYLKDTRPLVSKNCMDSQLEFNKIASKYPGVNWVLIVSGLWTGESDLKEYQKKYEVPVSGLIDNSNKMFVQYGVKDFPTLILLKNGVEVFRTSELLGNSQLAERIKDL